MLTSNFFDVQYLELLDHVLTDGHRKQDRTGTGTISKFGAEMVFDLSDWSIPLLTTKRMHLPSVIHELIWYFSGSTNIQYLLDNNVRIWNEWADSNGDLGPLYGKKMRDWDGVDQLQMVLDTLRTDPDSRRMVVSYWDPTVLPLVGSSPSDNPVNGRQALAPCHYTWQVYTHINPKGERVLSLKMVQRSVDLFLGCPFNIAQYSIIMLMLCHMTGMKPGEFIWSGGDVHIYTNHVEQVETQLSRNPWDFPSPKVRFNRPFTSFEDFKYDDIEIVNYQSHARIPAPVAV